MSYAFLVAISLLAGHSLGLLLQLESFCSPPHSLRRDPSAPLRNSGDVSYYVSITLGGQSFSVLVDTGSSDLWVAGDIPHALDLGAYVDVQYTDQTVRGPIHAANLEFAGYSVADQAFILLSPDDTNKAGSGIIGLGPSSASEIYRTLESEAAYTVLDRIFQGNTSAPHYITMLLGRQQGNPTDNYAGNITIGEISSGYEIVEGQPKVDVTFVPTTNVGNQHFQVFIDKDGLIGPDGQSIPIQTEVDEAPDDSQGTAILDSGFSLTQLPKAAADAIYSRFEGAEYRQLGSGVGSTWVLPCDLEVNITFKFGGNEYPIHPMDATMDPVILGLPKMTDSRGQASCIGMFQPMNFDTGDNPTFDVILGMSFLRNTYTLFNYGDSVAPQSSTKGGPYVQFLSITDRAEAHSDFVATRLNGVDSTGNQTLKHISRHGVHKGLTIGLSIGLFALAVLLIGAILLFVHLRRKCQAAERRKAESLYSPILPAHHGLRDSAYSSVPSTPGETPEPLSPVHLHDPQLASSMPRLSG